MSARSFRIRMVAFIVLLSGGMLSAACLVFLKKMERIRVNRMDTAIENVAFSQLRVFHPHDVWPHLHRSINRALSETEDVEWTIRVITAKDRKEVFTGSNWPDYWDDSMIPELVELPRPHEHEDFRRPGHESGGDRPRERGVSERPQNPASNEKSRNSDGLDELIAEFGLGEPHRRPGFRRGGHPGGGPPRMKKHLLFDLLSEGEEGWRIGVFGNQWYILVVGMNNSAYQGEIRELKNLITWLLPSGLLLLTLGGFWVAHGALRPIRRLTKQAQGVTAKGLDRRICVGSADKEFAELIAVINEMLARLETSFMQATRFSSDAAHELKTPLTILQGELERLIQESVAGSEHQEKLVSLQDEVQRLGNILRKLLLLCQMDGGRFTMSNECIHLSRWCEDLAEDIQAFGPDLSVSMDVESDISFLGDPDTMWQVMQNLVSNAVKYNAKDGWIKISLKSDTQEIVFEIENAGPPIPPDERDRIFDRFYRVDASRSKVVEGTGLGLNLARELARAHGGDLVLKEQGNAFRLTLPQNADLG